jgi:predicted aldo/keto reductase-like oxidoreductase
MPDVRAALSRRALLQATTVAVLDRAACVGAQERTEGEPTDRNTNRMLPRRRLGRTHMRVTAIGSGGAGITGPEILYRAIDKGINYIDTAPAYGDSEDVFGEVMRTRRDQVFLATKWAVLADWTVAQCLASLHRSLRRLRTDHIDLLHLHSVDTGPTLRGTPRDGYARIDNPHLHRAMEQARQDGKVRYFGVSSHDPERGALLKHAIDTGRFDAIMVAFNFRTFDRSGMPELLAHARVHDIGVIGMRASGGDRPVHLPHVQPLTAQLAWMLTQEIHTVVNSETVFSEDSQDACLAAATLKLS